MGPKEELKAQKEKITQTLIEAALELAADTGYASLSLRSVARKAGIAPTSFYRHFRDIDEMGVAIIEKAADELEQCLSQAVDTMKVYVMADISLMQLEESIRKILVAPFVEHILDCMNQHSRLLCLFFQERAGSSPVLRQAAHKGMERFKDLLCIPIKTFIEKAGPPTSIGKKSDVSDYQIRWTADAMLLIVAAGAMENIFFPDQNIEAVKASLFGKLTFLLRGSIESIGIH